MVNRVNEYSKAMILKYVYKGEINNDYAKNFNNKARDGKFRT